MLRWLPAERREVAHGGVRGSADRDQRRERPPRRPPARAAGRRSVWLEVPAPRRLPRHPRRTVRRTTAAACSNPWSASTFTRTPATSSASTASSTAAASRRSLTRCATAAWPCCAWPSSPTRQRTASPPRNASGLSVTLSPASCRPTVKSRSGASTNSRAQGLRTSTFASYRDLPALADALLQHGFSADDVQRILGGNYARVSRASLGDGGVPSQVASSGGATQSEPGGHHPREGS